LPANRSLVSKCGQPGDLELNSWGTEQLGAERNCLIQEHWCGAGYLLETSPRPSTTLRSSIRYADGAIALMER